MFKIVHAKPVSVAFIVFAVLELPSAFGIITSTSVSFSEETSVSENVIGLSFWQETARKKQVITVKRADFEIDKVLNID